MNPKPLLALIHFTVPCAFTDIPHSFELFDALFQPPAVNSKKGRKCELAALYTNLKVLQEQQTQCHYATSQLFLIQIKKFARLGLNGSLTHSISEGCG
jgi:hypothetical protein